MSNFHLFNRKTETGNQRFRNLRSLPSDVEEEPRSVDSIVKIRHYENKSGFQVVNNSNEKDFFTERKGNDIFGSLIKKKTAKRNLELSAGNASKYEA